MINDICHLNTKKSVVRDCEANQKAFKALMQAISLAFDGFLLSTDYANACIEPFLRQQGRDQQLLYAYKFNEVISQLIDIGIELEIQCEAFHGDH